LARGGSTAVVKTAFFQRILALLSGLAGLGASAAEEETGARSNPARRARPIGKLTLNKR
jgi:hypothetical protein